MNVSRGARVAAGLFISSLIIAVAFQNCGQMQSAGETEASAHLSSTASTGSGNSTNGNNDPSQTPGQGSNSSASPTPTPAATPKTELENKQWTELAATGVVESRTDPIFDWTGSKAIIWGGALGKTVNAVNTGRILDLKTMTWTAMSLSGAPPAARYASSVWTGSKLFIWGGMTASNLVASGGIYDPATDTWQSMALAPRGALKPILIWHDSKMKVFNAANGIMMIYDPQTNLWSDESIPADPYFAQFRAHMLIGDKLYNIESNSRRGPGSNLFSFDLKTKQMTKIPSDFAMGHDAGAFAWTGTKLLQWGLRYQSAQSAYGDIYDPVANTFTLMTSLGAPPPLYSPAGVYADGAFYVWDSMSPTKIWKLK